MRSHVTLPTWLRTSAIVGVLGATIVTLGCTQKESNFFASLDAVPLTGSITAAVDGPPQGAPVHITGVGIDETQVAGSLGYTFDRLPLASYQLAVTPPSGYSCSPMTSSVDLSESLPSRTVIFTCATEPAFGSINFTTSGLLLSTTYPLIFSGTATFSGQLGDAGVVFENRAAGEYDWVLDLGASPMYTCMPLSGSFNLAAGATFTQAISCAPAVGTLSVSVLGGPTATIGYSGPATGGGSVGATPVLFPNLPPGAYTVAVTSPSGFNCLPSSTPAAITAGTTTAVQFECTAIVAQPAVVDLQFNAAPNFGGQITESLFMLPLTDMGLTVGMVNVERIGTLFSAPGPDRFGGSGQVGVRLDVRPTVSGSDFITTQIDLCVLNSALNAGNPAKVTMRDAGLVALGVSNLEMSPSCYNVMLPGGTRFVDVTGPIGISYDFSGIRLRR